MAIGVGGALVTRVRVGMIFWFIASLSIMIETTRLNLQSYGVSSPYQADNSQRSGSMIVHENKEDVPPWTISANSSSDLAAASGQENKKLFSHFFSHIPKSGSSYAFNVLNQMIWPSPEWQALEPKDKFRACNEATKSLRNFHRFRVEYKGTACTMWMTEQKYSDVPNHVYAIIRDPREHVLSMYFHCAESRDHKALAHRMPSLDEWLQAWVDAKGNTTFGNKTIASELGGRFRCYNPINFETVWTDFDPEKGKNDLKRRYTVIGDSSSMVKSVCAIFIRYAGWVPKHCNCSNLSQSTALIHAKNETAAQDRRQRKDRRTLRGASGASEHGGPNRQRGKMDYDSTKDAHGVMHHGATFQTTKHQDALITKLRSVDKVLYKVTKEVFQEQLEEIEKEHNVKVCDKFRADE